MTRLRNVILGLVLAVVGVASPAWAAPVAPTVGTWAPVSVTYAPGAVAITPPTSNSTGAWSYVSGNTNVITVAGSTMTPLAVGTATLYATQAATDSYTATTVSTTVTVVGAAPTLGAFPAVNATMDTPTVALTAPSSTSAGAWTYSVSDTSVATVSGSTLTLLKVGTAVVTASQAANWNWAAASTTAVLTVAGAAPAVGTWPDLTLTYGSVGTVTIIPPTSTSLGAWTYAVSDTSVATVVGTQLTLLKVGATTMTAVQAASGNFAAKTITRALTVLGGPPTLGAFADASAVLQPFGSNTATITPPTSNSTGAWTFTSSDTATATVSGMTVTMLKLGTVKITGVQAAAGNYAASAPVSMNFTVKAAVPPLGDWPNLNRDFGSADFTLSPPSSASAGAWTFASANPAIATVSAAGVVHVVAAGQVAVTATQAANWNWAQTSVTMTLTVLPIPPTVGTLAAKDMGVGDAWVKLVGPTSNSTGAWTFASSNAAVATVAGDALTVVAAGTATISAVQAAAGNYSQSAPVTFTLTVRPRATVGDFASVTVVAGTAAKTLVAPTSNSTGAWTYTSSDPAVATVTGNVLTFVGVGAATIVATQAFTDAYAATQKTFIVTVQGKKPTLGKYTEVSVVFSSKPVTIPVPTSNSTGIWTITLMDASLGTIVEGNKLATVKAGTILITASQGAAGQYASTAVSALLTVKPYVKASIAKRVVTIEVRGTTAAKALIDGKAAKIGANTLKPGKHTVAVKFNGLVIYSKTITIK